MRRIVVGDIHGCFLTLRTLLRDKIRITTEDEIYLLGDYIDRGPRSRQVLEYLIELKWQGFHVFPIKGNHEQLLLNALEDESFMHAWYNNGAEDTLKSFEIPEELMFDYDAFNLIPERYLSFLKSLPLYYETPEFITVHAGLNFGKENVFEDEDAMIWIRDFEYQGGKIENKVLIHGHTPMEAENIKRDLKEGITRVLNLDAGCVYKDLKGYGNLVAYDFDQNLLFQQKNID